MSNGKTVGGVGRLTDAVVDKIKTYHGFFMRNNKDKKKSIISAICGPILSHNLLPK